MSRIHYFQRYSSPENTVTNNTLQLFARIYDYSPSRLGQLLSGLMDVDVDIGIEITQQTKERNSIPDGLIIQRSFKILIEAKIDSPTYVDQLLRHAAGFGNEEKKILLLLVKRKDGQEESIANKVKRINAQVIFKVITYEDICKAVNELFDDYETSMKSLTEDYYDYCAEAGLFDQSRNLMRIVPCGESLGINLKYGIYFQPSDRGYRKHKYVGVYKNKAVQALWEIDSVFDIELTENVLKKTLIQGRNTDEYDEKIRGIIADAKIECGYEIAEKSRFFCGEVIETKFRKTSPGGIQGARFFNLKNVLERVSEVKDIATELRSITWE